jgi:hypothetical protein
VIIVTDHSNARAKVVERIMTKALFFVCVANVQISQPIPLLKNTRRVAFIVNVKRGLNSLDRPK